MSATQADHLCAENFQRLADGVRIIFSRIDCSAAALQIQALGKPIVLITHGHDLPVHQGHKSWLPQNVLRWYSPNVCVHDKRIKAIPLGVASSNWMNGDFKNIRQHMGKPKQKDLFASFAISTNPNERIPARNIAVAYGGSKTVACYPQFHERHKPLPHEKFIEQMAEHRFVLSPPGNGIDCIRTWEALYLGCIPICKRSLAMSFFKDLPILFVDSWDEITPVNLEKAELDLKDKWKNTDKLWLDWWKNDIEATWQQQHS